jgi:hypothetical protein
LRVCDLSDRRVLLIDGGTLVCILSSRGITVYNEGVLVCISSSKSIIVCNLGVGRALACEVNPKATLVYSLDLFKWVGYKANDSIEFKGVKGSAFFNLFLDLLLTLFY